MARKPEFVTFTGADESTDIEGMLAIQGRAEGVEWGILFSPKLQGIGRYPPYGFVESLVGRGLRLAAHVCGGYAREVLASGRCEALSLFPQGTFGRVQVNTPDPADTRALAAFAVGIGARRAILQTRDAFPADDAVDWLYDASAGTGRLPGSWPEAPAGRALVGYAGGLGPDTLSDVLPDIVRAAGDVPYHLDMETRVRTEDAFDLDACIRVLEIVRSH